ncbi:putative DNA-binding transcriptional regulator YafY [Clostridium tetanomorphum]|uniref:WYL domain-containing protein n=1 Tax=Clostridium tetanomorphum TaxID=1553 RepID=A0A923IZB7_CLOTT|nr:WYL domain-containing protein [Clostridium tetanomorphum]KAJ52623.1 hypothetical protein CTM_06546 [Clostridium tetanomorphum DSM 665]MBC2396822.1 WYL domain-containing protein [Clostridium tetanomorphum]MBP1863216.1 putative DNA-binding transcriptional regulator YafY [Clostridium tetanomorphum]NRS84324.1 putative DNA-binding transcriptional regulator YafY [Clostridium tetanomorphum]NRZ97538.1 putative DNA-binding transcriptional regulator YafY [Clostridium tetanomorphum]
MGSNKSEGLIYIFEKLLYGKVVNKKQAAEELKVSTKTIERYINNIKNYLSEQDRLEDISYSRQKCGYVLNFRDEKRLEKNDILAISKVLLESRGFSKEEIKRLIAKLMYHCSYEERFYIKEFIINQLDNYVPPRHNKNLIDKIWNLSKATKSRKKIKISYNEIGNNGKLKDKSSISILYPQGMLFSEYYFYLVAFIEGKGFDYPAMYRLDRIQDYTILEEGFKVDYIDRFKEGEFRNLIQFMQAGEIETVKFTYRGESIESVMDRLPTAEIIKEGKGEFVIKARVFGKGIKMWLLSQGEMVEVLEPEGLRKEMKKTIKKLTKYYMD